MIIRKAKAGEASIISQLAIRSKAVWGYDELFMHECVDELSHSEVDILERNFLYFVAEIDEKVAGFYKLENLRSENVILEALFIEPEYIGQGLGKKLFLHARETATHLNAKYLDTHSDPFAEGFYKKMGARKIGESESGSIPERFLPLMRVDLINQGSTKD